MPTPHLSAEPGDFAPIVLMPGDPLRAKFIADNYLDDARLVTDVRNMLGFTGTVNGVPISVQGSGMGIPSISIYATELIREYGVTTIVRVGSCGAIKDDINLGDVLLAVSAGTDSTVNRSRLGGRDFAATADFGLLTAAAAAAERRGVDVKAGRLFTSDFFYGPDEGLFDLLDRYGFLAVEMEAAGLYGLAAEEGIAALAVCTVSDHIKREEAMTAEDRQTTFDDMIGLVLEAVTTGAS